MFLTSSLVFHTLATLDYSAAINHESSQYASSSVKGDTYVCKAVEVRVCLLPIAVSLLHVSMFTSNIVIHQVIL